MKPQHFIGRFPELAEFDQAQQDQLLEQARHDAFVVQGLSKRALCYLLLCMLLGFALAVSPLLLGCGFSAQLAGIALGLVIAIGLYQRLHRSLLSRGLERVLAQPKDPS